MVLAILISLLFGAVFGLIPCLVGHYFKKPGIGNLGMVCCCMGGLIWGLLSWSDGYIITVLLAVGFTIAVFVAKQDFPWPWKQTQAPPQPQQQPGNVQNYGLNVVCLNGPLRGQIYTLGSAGLKFGRDNTCGVRLPDSTPGVSRQHCAIRWQQGVPVLVDLGSTHGTYLGSGQKLPPQYPVELAPGSRFYLGDTACLFQVTVA